MTLLRISCCAIAAVTLVTATTTARSEDWPTKAVQVISPFTAGNANDTVARVVLDQVSRQIGKPFVIEIGRVAEGRSGWRWSPLLIRTATRFCCTHLQ